MAHIGKGNAHAAQHFHRLAVGLGPELGHNLLGILDCVIGLHQLPAAALRLAVAPLGVLLLDMGGILQHDAAQVGGGGGGVDGAAEPVLVKVRYPARVIDVGVGQQNRLHLAGGQRQGRVLIGIAPLLHPAIHQKPMSGGFHQRAAAGHLMRGAQKGQFHSDILPVGADRGQLVKSCRPTPYLGASGRVKSVWNAVVASLMAMRTAQ